MKNKGAAGVDEVTVAELKSYLQTHWLRIKEELLAGQYTPLPAKRIDIPKPGGGTRMRGIPCGIDRAIQQAIHQILQPIFDGDFSEQS